MGDPLIKNMRVQELFKADPGDPRYYIVGNRLGIPENRTSTRYLRKNGKWYVSTFDSGRILDGYWYTEQEAEEFLKKHIEEEAPMSMPIEESDRIFVVFEEEQMKEFFDLVFQMNQDPAVPKAPTAKLAGLITKGKAYRGWDLYTTQEWIVR